MEIHKTITDEAKIKELTFKNEVNSRKIQDKEKDRKHEIKMFLIIEGVLFLIILISAVFGFIYSKTYIVMPESSKYYCERNYVIVKNELEDLGFKNIEVRTIDDLVIGLFSKEEDVESISIAGVKNFNKGKEFKKSDKVVITYHIFKEKNK